MRRARVYRMSFGKYRGRSLPDVPTEYLCWLANEGIRDARLGDAVEAELDRRAGLPADRSPPATTLGQAIAPILGDWYRELSQRFHPDRGGSHAEMKVVNIAVERLRELVDVA